MNCSPSLKKEIKAAILSGKSIHTSSHALGGGEWSLEVTAGGEYIGELVGENGQNNHYCPSGEGDDLHEELDRLIKEVEDKLLEEGKIKPSPEGWVRT